MKRLAILTLLLFSYSLTLKASEYPGAVFLMIFPGARAIGLGGAFTSIADDAYATYYNPAGIAFQKSIDISYSYCDSLPGLYSGMKYKYYCMTIPITNSVTYGFSYDYMSTGLTQVVDEYGNLLGEYTAYDYAIGASIGVKINKNNSIGVTGKFIHSLLVPDWVWQMMPELGIIAGGTANDFAFDIGTLSHYSSAFGISSIGFAIQNIGPKIKYTQTGAGDPLPLAIKLGISHTITAENIFPNIEQEFWLTKWFMNQSHIVLSLDIRKSLVGQETPWRSVGVEFSPFAVFSVRYGYFVDPDGCRHGSTFGLGLNLKFLKIDYGDDSNIYDFETENRRWSMSINIGTPILSEDGIVGLFINK